MLSADRLSCVRMLWSEAGMSGVRTSVQAACKCPSGAAATPAPSLVQTAPPCSIGADGRWRAQTSPLPQQARRQQLRPGAPGSSPPASSQRLVRLGPCAAPAEYPVVSLNRTSHHSQAACQGARQHTEPCIHALPSIWLLHPGLQTLRAWAASTACQEPQRCSPSTTELSTARCCAGPDATAAEVAFLEAVGPSEGVKRTKRGVVADRAARAAAAQGALRAAHLGPGQAPS